MPNHGGLDARGMAAGGQQHERPGQPQRERPPAADDRNQRQCLETEARDAARRPTAPCRSTRDTRRCCAHPTRRSPPPTRRRGPAESAMLAARNPGRTHSSAGSRRASRLSSTWPARNSSASASTHLTAPIAMSDGCGPGHRVHRAPRTTPTRRRRRRSVKPAGDRDGRRPGSPRSSRPCRRPRRWSRAGSGSPRRLSTSPFHR